MNAPVTQVMKVMAPNAPQSITANQDSTTVMPMHHAVLMDQTSAVHVTLGSVEMEPPVLTTMNVPMVALSVTSTPLATTMMVDTHVIVTADLKVMANNAPMLMNALIVHVMQTQHVTTPMVDSPVHVTMDTAVMVTHVLM